MVNQCGTCGKFKSWDDLHGHYTPDTQFTCEEIWYECRDCIHDDCMEDAMSDYMNYGINDG